jgi:SAM-dependent MidA family methyltransferase
LNKVLKGFFISKNNFKLVGVWLLNEWIILKNIYENDLPDIVELIEMGPGKGTLINDVLRVYQLKNNIKY